MTIQHLPQSLSHKAVALPIVKQQLDQICIDSSHKVPRGSLDGENNYKKLKKQQPRHENSQKRNSSLAADLREFFSENEYFANINAELSRTKDMDPYQTMEIVSRQKTNGELSDIVDAIYRDSEYLGNPI